MKTLHDFLIENAHLEDKVVSSEVVNDEEKVEFESGDCNISLTACDGSYSDFEYITGVLVLKHLQNNTTHALSNQRVFYKALQDGLSLESALGKAVLNSLLVDILVESIENQKSAEPKEGVK